MALAIPAIAGLISANLASVAIAGISQAQLAFAVATGFCNYMQTGVIVVTVDIGTLGAGAGLGQGLILPPPALLGLMTAGFAGAVIAGVMAVPAATAISNGLSQALALATLVTAHAGVGVGSGVAKVIPNPGVSIPSFVGGFAAAGLVGISAPGMATAIATALDAGLAAATGVVVISGPASPLPGSGAGTGKVI